MISYVLRKFFSNSASIFAIRILYFLKSKTIAGSLTPLAENYKLTSTFRSYDLYADKEFLNYSAKAYKQDHIGNYQEAIRLRMLTQKISLDSLNAPNDFFPPFIGSRWTSFIGHLAALALHSRAQTLNLIPKGQRYVLNAQKVANRSLFELFQENYVSLTNEYLADLEFFPATSGLFENYHLVKTNVGHLETHAFMEYVFTNHEKNHNGETILSKQRVESLLREESRKWINANIGKDFVVIHLRNTGNSERRDVDISAYYQALKEIEKSGLQIINFGPEIKMDDSPKIINLNKPMLQPYLTSKAKFAITSTSGPTLLPGLFGVPNLATNLTSPGRSMINCNSSTFYLPKRVTFQGGDMCLSKILSSPIAYDERDSGELAKRGYQMFNNTELELTLAVKWMLEIIDKNHTEFSTIEERVKAIQHSTNAVSRGRLVPTFLETNKSYLE
jgi:putative glycosyltransferase (TIGR04372 family)